VLLVNLSVQHFRSTNVAILLKAASPPSGVAENGDKIKWYWVLALVHPDIRGGQLGKTNWLVLYR
jgi:hypothetical protein